MDDATNGVTNGMTNSKNDCVLQKNIPILNEKYTQLMVDGTSFKAKKDTLLKIPLFESFLDYQQTHTTHTIHTTETNNIIYVDRDYQLFEEIYTYVICNRTDFDLSKKVLSEFEYYGLTLDENIEFEMINFDSMENTDENTENTDFISLEEGQMAKEILEKVQFELENLCEVPFYVNACGHIFQTTKKRLMTCEYFSKMFFENRWIESSFDVGTHDMPLFIDIPYKAFTYILGHLRNKNIDIPVQYIELSNMLLISSLQQNIHTKKYKNTQNTIVHKNNKHKFKPEQEIHDTNTSNTHRNYNSQGALIKLISNTVTKLTFDKYLHQTPVTFFQHVKRKCTNTAKDILSINPSTNSGWGIQSQFKINKVSDMINTGYLNIIIYDGNTINWKHNLLYRIIKMISFEYRGNKIDQIYNNTLWQEDMLFEESNWTDIIEHYKDGNNKNIHLLIPLRFFFMHHLSTSLPITSLHESPVINVEMSNFHDCTDDVIDFVPEINVNLELSCHYLDTDERQHIRRNDWNNIIHQHEYSIFKNDPNNTVCSLSLDLRGSIELLVFTLHVDEDDLFWCGYETQFDDPLISAAIHAENNVLFDHNAFYYRIIDKKESTLNIPDIPIYTYSFGSFLRESMYTGQPSGTINASAINNIKLNLRMKHGIKRICVWAIKKNTCLISNGSCNVMFS